MIDSDLTTVILWIVLSSTSLISHYFKISKLFVSIMSQSLPFFSSDMCFNFPPQKYIQSDYSYPDCYLHMNVIAIICRCIALLSWGLPFLPIELDCVATPEGAANVSEDDMNIKETGLTFSKPSVLVFALLSLLWPSGLFLPLFSLMLSLVLFSFFFYYLHCFCASTSLLVCADSQG